MKKIIALILLLVAVFVLHFDYNKSSSAYAQEEESDSSIHEMPASDKCSLIIMQIRQLVYSLKQTKKEISSFMPPADSTLKNEENKEQQEYEQNLKHLQEKESALQQQIDIKEQQLETCGQRPEDSQEK